MTDSFIGRQAIYDRNLDVHAYELLYRGSPQAEIADVLDGDMATATVMANAFLEVGAQKLVGDAFCFINLTRSFITGKLPLPLPADRVVVEILEDVEPTPDIIRGAKRLKDQGARIALDDYIMRSNDGPLLELCDYVKVDLLAQDRQATIEIAKRLKRYDLALLAEKVETEEEMQFCKEIGFQYFQGFFLTRPEVVSGSKVPANRVALLRMLQRLLDPNVDFDELVKLIGQDASLAFKLLRYANSTRFAPAHEIETLGQMVVMLGIKTVRKVVSLMILVALDDKPGDLLEHTLVRARMCELIGQSSSKADPASFFTVGLLSTIDAITGTTMESALEFIPLASDLESALLEGAGEFGHVLECVRSYERADWEKTQHPVLSSSALSEMYLDAVEYSREVWGGVDNLSDAA